jgi:hypothetical protein
MDNKRCSPLARTEAVRLMKYVRQTLAAVAVLTVVTLLAFGLKATPVASLFSDGDGDRGPRPGQPQQEKRGPGGPDGEGRFGSFDPIGIVGSAQTIVPQAAIIAAIAVFEKRRRQKKSDAMRAMAEVQS